MSTMMSDTSTKLVTTAIANHARFKDVAAELERRTPDADAASALVEAYRAEEAPPWLAAHLLGCIGHELGYATVREILLNAPGMLAESYAGPALAKILGERALPDLCALLRDAPKQISREGAAYGLKRLGPPSAEAALLEAATTGRIRWQTAASLLADIPIAPRRLCGLLRSGEVVQLRLATEIVWVALRHARSGQNTWIYDVAAELEPMIRDVLANPALSMAPRKRTGLEAWVSRGL
ncbi:hypothetical protein [Polyangium jinanense]|uniref:HEAT repeat domain-containing protein n=1 Tax=Polyangium jinanense TaxID=2829994 RepID=A0A9X3WZI0_9BACT|nr:hypothetical protein [Polyangium jinanense]MDC3979815.1 hypothetical protein [Polyangium jinanense]